jgi:hypothetical protein
MAIEKIRFTGNIMKIPIRDIEVINPRQRDKERFEEIVESIERLGLLKPILVNSCFLAEKGKYELLCGEGRLLSCQKLGHETILAEIINCSRKTGYVVSLVENMARKSLVHWGFEFRISIFECLRMYRINWIRSFSRSHSHVCHRHNRIRFQGTRGVSSENPCP